MLLYIHYLSLSRKILQSQAMDVKDIGKTRSKVRQFRKGDKLDHMADKVIQNFKSSVCLPKFLPIRFLFNQVEAHL